MSRKKIDRDGAILSLRTEAQKRVTGQTLSKSKKNGLSDSKTLDRERAIANLREEAHRRVVKNEVMKFRLESENLERLLLLAYRRKIAVGTLVREWVIEKLDQAELGPEDSPQTMAISIIAQSLAGQRLLSDADVGRIEQLLKPSENKLT